jgi:hypothetical protein
MGKVLACTVAIWVACTVLKLTGFCFTKPGWNSNRDMIEVAFQHGIAGGWRSTPAVTDVSAYLAEYPQCCSVSNQFTETPILNAMFFRRFYGVSIKYPVADPVENDGQPYYQSIVIMDCCSLRIAETYGINSPTSVPRGPASERSPKSLSTM